MKLTNAQQEVISKAMKKINQACSCDTAEEYFINYEARYYNDSCNTPEKFKNTDAKGWNKIVNDWENEKNGIVFVMCNSKTIKKLEEYGIIKILHDSCGETLGIDKIQVLKF